MRISLGRAANDAVPVLTECDWPAFVAWLAANPRTPAGITPAEYAVLKGFPTKSPEGQRLAADKSGPYVVLADCNGEARKLVNLVASHGVPLDFDSGVTLDTIRTVLQHYAFAAYTTYAHQPGVAERWRVFVPTAAPMDAASHYATWETLNAAFAGLADVAAKDPVRLSYLPGKCLHPDAAGFYSQDGAFLQPTPGAASEPTTLQPSQASGPVAGWAGPSNDDELVTIACATRTRPDERFGEPVHFAQLWTANEQWLAQRFPSRDQRWDMTQADMALAGELAYWTGSDRDRMHRLMLASGLARDDADWQERKALRAVERAADNAKQWAFMQTAKQAEAQARRDELVSQLAVTIPPDGLDDIAAHAQMWTSDATGAPPPPSATDALLANAGLPTPAAMPGLNDYWAYLPNAQFIHRPTGMLHVASSVDGTIGKDARAALIVSRPVHSMTWAPGFPERFQFRDIDKTNERAADSWLYNTYQPPKDHTTAGDATPWVQLLERLYPNDAQHLLDYFADAVQNPHVKCNHAVILGSGVHGIGKDTLLVPIRYAVGERNFRTIKPSDLAASFNPWVATRILQVSESRDLGDGFTSISRYEMYERCKDLCAAPPAMIESNSKYQPQTQVLNVLRLILTTNHRVDGVYIPPEDRRHYCAWSDAGKLSESDANAIHQWYAAGGLDFVAHFLATRDLSHFNRAKAPPQTEWWAELVAGGRPAEDERFNDAVEKLGRPEWLTAAQLAAAGGLELAGWMAAPGNRRKLERELDRAGYRRLANPADARGRWYVEGQRVPIYRRADIRATDILRKFNAA